MRQEAGDDVCEEDEAERQEYALNLGVVALDDEQPDERAGKRDRDVPAHPEQLERRGHARELGRGRGEVGYYEEHHAEKGQLHPEPLAYEVGKTLARDHAHTGGHLLHHRQVERDEEQQPQKAVPLLRARDRVGRNAAGVVVRVGRDETRPHHRDEYHHAAAVQLP